MEKINFKKGESITLGFLLNAGYDMARIQSCSAWLGGRKFPLATIGQMLRCEIASTETHILAGKYKLILWLDDSVLGIKKIEVADVEVSFNHANDNNTSINTGYDFVFPLAINELAITLGDILYDYVKGADGEKGEDGAPAVLPPNIVIDTDYVHTDNNYTDGDKIEVGKVAGKENTGVAQSLVTQLIDGATDNTLKKLQDKITAINAIIGGSAPDGDNIVNTVAELLAVFSTFPEGSDMVTLLTAKLNVTDVYNALDQLLAGKALDARQGKVLKDLCDGLRTDLTNHNHNGTYEPANANIQQHISATGNPHGTKLTDLTNVTLTETTPTDTDSVITKVGSVLKASTFSSIYTYIKNRLLAASHTFSQLITFSGGVKIGNNTGIADAALEGTKRYRIDVAGSYEETCMRTSDIPTFEWVLIKQIAFNTNWDIKLQATGDGNGVGVLNIDLNSSSTIEIAGGTFYTDAAGTLGASTSKVLNSGNNVIYVRVTTGEATVSVLQGRVKVTRLNNYDGSGNYPNLNFNLSSIPSVMTLFVCYGNNTITGNLSSIPSVMTVFVCSGQNTITGNLSSIPSVMTLFACYGNNTITGNLSSIPSVMTAFQCYGQNTITGNLSSIPSVMTYFVCSGNNTINQYTTKIWPANMNNLQIYGADNLDANENDAVLIDLAATTWTGEKSIRLKGTRTSASNAAVASLQAQGVTVVIN